MALIPKIGEFLNADVGKMLKTDVGDIAKGAGKVLKADVGDIVKGTGKVFTSDLGELLMGTEEEKAAAKATAEGKANPTTTGKLAPKVAPKATEAPVSASPPPPDDTEFDIAEPVPVPTHLVEPPPRLTDDLAVRVQRPKPEGTSLVNLLPYQVGKYERSRAMGTGDLASDPVTIIYAFGKDAVHATVTLYWDEEEAMEQVVALKDRQGNIGRIGANYAFAVGKCDAGPVFAWTRGCYFFQITTPKDSTALLRFLTVFPY
ncbi:MAG: hypothetical protein HY255_02265 [Betaproteobacteria bacterium]|nr:hypothetical protein [Betaproteobacteria bacterium]